MFEGKLKSFVEANTPKEITRSTEGLGTFSIGWVPTVNDEGNRITFVPLIKEVEAIQKALMMFLGVQETSLVLPEKATKGVVDTGGRWYWVYESEEVDKLASIYEKTLASFFE